MNAFGRGRLGRSTAWTQIDAWIDPDYTAAARASPIAGRISNSERTTGRADGRTDGRTGRHTVRAGRTWSGVCLSPSKFDWAGLAPAQTPDARLIADGCIFRGRSRVHDREHGHHTRTDATRRRHGSVTLTRRKHRKTETDTETEKDSRWDGQIDWLPIRLLLYITDLWACTCIPVHILLG